MTEPAGEDTGDVLLDVEENYQPEALITRAYAIYGGDLERLERIKRYFKGEQDGPYSPRNSDAEYELLAKRSKLNILDLICRTPAQCLFAEGVRFSDPARNLKEAEPGKDLTQSVWGLWQRNRLDARQMRLYLDALRDGIAYVAVSKPDSGEDSRHDYTRADFLSAQRTVSLWYDQVNDERPAAVMTLEVVPSAGKEGRGKYWDDENMARFTIDAEGTIKMSGSEVHGFEYCPVVPFVARMDLEGNVSGLIEGLFEAQDSLNQSKFDMLVGQSYSSHIVRTATGMVAPPLTEKVIVTVGDVREELEDIDPDNVALQMPDDTFYGYEIRIVRDEEGTPVPKPVTADASRFLVAEDPDTKFDSLPATPMDGFLAAIAGTMSNIATMAQMPQHYFSGVTANLSADALAVAEASLGRMIQEFQHSFGESWEQVLGLFAESLGQEVDYAAEMQWRDMSPKSFGVIVDGLVKLAEGLEIPGQGLWEFIPGMTKGKIDQLATLREERMDEAITQGLVAPQAPATKTNRTATVVPNNRGEPSIARNTGTGSALTGGTDRV